ncbi:MAG TPA: prenyltransferase/squalene oxidase repeat-containing protein [Herpetosiphonaceae bacterium]
MSLIVDTLVRDLHDLLPDLGNNGGLMSPSIYDTAQALRLTPPKGRVLVKNKYRIEEEDEVWPVVRWLLGQQQADGGWGSPFSPLSRTVPTLASVLALKEYCTRRTTQEAVEEGLTFLRRQLSHWNKEVPDDLPVGAELMLPRLLEDAAAKDVLLHQAPYRALLELGRKRRAMIAAAKPGAGTTAAYSWEAWGATPDPAIIDGTGGVGHSPAATAAWIAATQYKPHLADYRERAKQYMKMAAAATSENIIGVLPTAWPITRYEQAFGLYALLVGEIHTLPALQDVMAPQLDDLARALRPQGLGFSDDFIADGDDTAAAVAILKATGRDVDLGLLEQYQSDEYFLGYPGELQPSVSLTARGVHALQLFGKDVSRWWPLLVRHQRMDGSWAGDKWNSSWLYTTCHVLIALQGSPFKDAIREAVHALRVFQFEDGGWGMIDRSTTVETAYAVLALHAMRNEDILEERDLLMLRRGYEWLLNHYRPFRMKEYKCWLNKEIYCPQRIDRAYELSAMLAVTLGEPLP